MTNSTAPAILLLLYVIPGGFVDENIILLLGSFIVRANPAGPPVFVAVQLIVWSPAATYITGYIGDVNDEPLLLLIICVPFKYTIAELSTALPNV